MDINEYLSHFDRFTKDPTLKAMEFLMEGFDNPHNKLKIIHVAGTNGKGSVCEMLSSILVNAGYKVGKFISPQLIKFNETISINNNLISDSEIEEILIQLSEKIDEYNSQNEIKVKWFEVITSIAFIYFAKMKCDFVVLETGLGGTTDCTNIADSMISVINSIGYDHMDVLGDTILEIASQKAGIIKENSDTVFLYQEEILPVIENTCVKNSTTLHLVNSKDITNYSYDEEYQKFSYKNNKDILVNLKGKKQTENASMCIECIEILRNKGYQISDNALRTGLKTVVHRARFETLNKNPLIIYDGGHNQNAIQNLKTTISQYYSSKKKVYIISILKTKDYKEVIKEITEDSEAIFFFTDGNDKQRYVCKEDLYKEAIQYVNAENVHKEILKDAIEIAKNEYKDRVIFVIGSFYIYKDVVQILGIKDRN